MDRLHRLLTDAHARFGQDVDRIDPDRCTLPIEAYPCGKTGVIAFVGDYALTGWEHHDIRAASRDAYRHLHQRLKARGFTRHMVFPLNFRSVILTRKLGAVPVGRDDNGYVHHHLTLEAFEKAAAQHLHREVSEHGQEVSTAEGA
jgi:hypothetical protein